MAFNFYDTHTLLASVQQLPPLHSFLLDRYFPPNAASDVVATDDVRVDYRTGSKKAAPFVAPRKGGITILREGYTMKRFTPAHIAPKRPLSIDDLKKRGFGEALYTNLTPAQRQGVIMLGDLDELRDMNTRRKEAMAAEVILPTAALCTSTRTTSALTRKRKSVTMTAPATRQNIPLPQTGPTLRQAASR